MGGKKIRVGKKKSYSSKQKACIGLVYLVIAASIFIACRAAYGGKEKNENAASVATTLIGGLPPVLFLNFRMSYTSPDKQQTYQAVAAGGCVVIGTVFIIFGWGQDIGWIGLNILVGVVYGGVQALLAALLEPKQRTRLPEFTPVLTDEYQSALPGCQ